ncbi:hypothetical protein LGM85_30225 [Burkholderia multivorans]|nr:MULTISPECIES: hypothetical protein [Burkholderia cepacia complex]MBR8152641.1 hypothetical protein [Burkholderia vietnamiensis]MBU9312907.1 hypothetical protein [Burkholderia multivorans]MBU9391510.1 hypothetical protein [Burkholderia multivorans]MCA8488202.1 hypothetical protein [Burkholderia multivorans]MCL4663302.1 hypothetical protein [Burkholderia multivorans]
MQQTTNREKDTRHLGDEISKEFVLGAIVAAALFGLAIKICVRLLA